MTADPTPHEILGIGPNATEEEIRAAYLKQKALYSDSPRWIGASIETAYQQLSSGTAATANANKSTQASAGNWLTESLPLQNETTYFILVNVLDIFMTYLVMSFGAVESNPIANFFYDRYGFAGMIAFKLILVAIVCTTSQIVARKNMRYAKFILWTGIIVVGLVVLYSMKLLSGQLY